ncbi:MAG: ribose 5-phosphate isomerase B [Actinomycetales bacterium]|nr:ribose 5-phosphate isomerase B [Actinomycetales bacterium]
MKIAIGSDHAGFRLKEAIGQWLAENGYEVLDVGTYSEDRVDYPDFGAKVGLAVSRGEADRGVAVCGSGEGICMAANKIAGIRGGVVRDREDAEIIRRHNNANVACFGERFTTPEITLGALQVFLETGFDGGRHQGRIDKLAVLDQTHGNPQG